MRRPQRPLKIPRFSHSWSAFAFVEAVALCEMEHGVPQEPICFGLITAPIGFEPVDDVGIQAHCDGLFYRPIELADFGAAPVIFSRDRVAEILNLQPHSGKCKPYQVKQVRNVIINYRLAGEADA